MKHWLEAFRLRTLPLALSSIGMGTFLAAAQGKFNLWIFILCSFTTIFLQILSNLANDYGDSQHGADSDSRKGPKRAVQSGKISSTAMKKMIYLFIALSFFSGVALLVISVGMNIKLLLFFLGLGIMSILAAMAYTMGKRPYGYAGLGDLFVLLFFGVVGVVGSNYLYAGYFNPNFLLPAISCGLFSVAVLNINNIRDIESDKEAGKMSIPVRLGRDKAVIYHGMILFTGILASVLFVIVNYYTLWQLLFLVTLPLFVMNFVAVKKNKKPDQLDPKLKQMALTTLLFVITFGIGQLL